jgi:hypothetical protein
LRVLTYSQTTSSPRATATESLAPGVRAASPACLIESLFRSTKHESVVV